MTSAWPAGFALAAAAAAPAAGQELVRNLVIASDPQPFTANDLLWMEVRTDNVQLAESMNVYASRAGVFVPLGEFSRVLELAVGVFPAQRRAEGWVLSPDRQLIVDLAAQRATLAGRSIAFTPDQAAIYDDDLYVRLDLLEQLVPVKFKADASAQILVITPTEPLPFQRRQERELRRAVLASEPDAESAVRVATPYRLFTPPAFDVNLGGQLTRDGVDQARRFDLRAAGDLLGAGFEGYVGSNDDGEVSDVRLSLTRKDPRGRALGALGGTRAGIGDVYTPSMPIGAAGFGGRGIFYTSAPLESVDLATPLNLRGELALGEEVELYVNEVLQAAQTSPVQGRYEFLDVPLAFGLNTIRLVIYGSQGQTREVVRRINFGDGQIEPGRLVLRMGVVEQGATVVKVGDPLPGLESGAARAVLTADYGVTPGLTISGGFARFTPTGMDARTLGSVGLRGSLGPVATQVDAAFDDQGGQGVTLGMAARPFAISLVGRHSEYSGGFIDETRQLGLASLATLKRATDFRADGQITTHGVSIPFSLNVKRLEREDDSRMLNAELRASAPVGRFYASSSVAYESESGPAIDQDRWIGATDIGTLASRRLQLRGGLTYELSPQPSVETAYATADWQLSETNALRLGVVRTLEPQSETSFQLSNLWRARTFDVAFNLAYETRSQEWRVGIQLGFGFGFDPTAGRYRMTRPGIASGGSLAVNAWVDENGDGRRQPNEPGVPGIVADTPGGALSTDPDGYALAVGLGDGAAARVRLNTEAVEDPFLVAGPPVLEVVPRPGRTAVIDYPMQRSGEVELSAQLVREDGAPRPLAALNVELVSQAGGAVIQGRSDHAGVLFFEGVRPGAYTVRLQAEQARTLGLTLTRPVSVTVPAGGGFVRGAALQVTVERGTRQ